MRDYSTSIVKINTPWGSGTGFLVKNFNCIVTNRHVVSLCRTVVISGINFSKTKADVIYVDPLYDLAFIKLPQSLPLEPLEIFPKEEYLHEGKNVWAIGHPLDFNYTNTKGIISKLNRKYEGLDYIQTDTPINPGNSGGPLMDEKGRVVGINTWIIAKHDGLGFAIPYDILQKCLEEFFALDTSFAVRCASCSNIVTLDTLQNGYCPYCGAKMNKEEFDGKQYIPSEIAIRIEAILEALGYDIFLIREGENYWKLTDNQATTIFYDQENQSIRAMSYLIKLPKQGNDKLYKFLLRENNKIARMSFSIINNMVVLETQNILVDDFHIETAYELFSIYLNYTTRYSNVLINRYGGLKFEIDD